MPGVKGSGGPVPKRSDQRRRRNKPARDVARVGGPKVEGRPPTNGKWHPVAKRWYNSLAQSRQSVFYEPSDWALAYVIAESMSRELMPQKILGESGKVIAEVVRAPKGSSLAAWLKGMTALLVAEGDRRRLQIELDRPGGGDNGEGDADVSWLADARNRLNRSG